MIWLVVSVLPLFVVFLPSKNNIALSPILDLNLRRVAKEILSRREFITVGSLIIPATKTVEVADKCTGCQYILTTLFGCTEFNSLQGWSSSVCVLFSYWWLALIRKMLYHKSNTISWFTIFLENHICLSGISEDLQLIWKVKENKSIFSNN